MAPRTAWIIGSLAPAAACLMLTAGILNSHTGSTYPAAHEMVASNWSEAPFVVDDFAAKQNHWSSVTFDSTNRSNLGTTIDSFRH